MNIQNALLTYNAAHKHLIDLATPLLASLADDKELMAALADSWETLPSRVARAFQHPRCVRIHITTRKSSYNEELGVEMSVFNKKGNSARWRSIGVPLSALIEAPAFKAWRDNAVASHAFRVEAANLYAITRARESLAKYRRLPKEVREANPVPGVKL